MSSSKHSQEVLDYLDEEIEAKADLYRKYELCNPK